MPPPPPSPGSGPRVPSSGGLTDETATSPVLNVPPGNNVNHEEEGIHLRAFYVESVPRVNVDDDATVPEIRGPRPERVRSPTRPAPSERGPVNAKVILCVSIT